MIYNKFGSSPYATGTQGSFTQPSVTNSILQGKSNSSNPYQEALMSTAGYYPLKFGYGNGPMRRSDLNEGQQGFNWSPYSNFFHPIDPTGPNNQGQARGSYGGGSGPTYEIQNGPLPQSGYNGTPPHYQHGGGYPVDPGSKLQRPPQAQYGVGISDSAPNDLLSAYYQGNNPLLYPGDTPNGGAQSPVSPDSGMFHGGSAPAPQPYRNNGNTQLSWYGAPYSPSAQGKLDTNGNPILSQDQILNTPVGGKAKAQIGGKSIGNFGGEQKQGAPSGGQGGGQQPPANMGPHGEVYDAQGNVTGRWIPGYAGWVYTDVNGLPGQPPAPANPGGQGAQGGVGGSQQGLADKAQAQGSAYPGFAQRFFRGETKIPGPNGQGQNPDPGGYQGGGSAPDPGMFHGGNAGRYQGSGGYGSYAGGGGGRGGSFQGGSHPRGDYTQANPQYLSDLLNKINEYYTNVGQQGERSLRGAAALTNMQDSGAFGTALGNYYRDLGAQQGKEGAGAIFTGSENEQNRLLQNALARISQETGMYGADAAARAQLGSARIGADASRYGDDVRRELGYAGYDVNREQFGANNMLDWYRLMLGQMGSAAGYGPESVLNNGQVPNGAIYVPYSGGH